MREKRGALGFKSNDQEKEGWLTNWGKSEVGTS